MSSWSWSPGPDWVPDLRLDPPVTDFEKYEHQFEQWLSDNYDKDTDTVFGVPNDDAYDDEKLFDRFMYEVIYDNYEGP